MRQSQRHQAEGILFTDHYQLTMAQLYFRSGLADKPSLFEYFFRSYPDYGTHQAGYCVSAGLEWLLDWLEEARFSKDDLAFLAGVAGSSGHPTFDPQFLAFLEQNPTFEPLVIEAIPEGRVVHPNEPVITVRGPLLFAQLLETSLLNHLNYQTLIATKASRVAESARGRAVLEFGMRRAPGRGASAGARAALIGGAHFTSNVGMARSLQLSPKGTHAHSMVQVHMALGMEELGAFRAYASTFPDDCLLLVDTIDTLGSGVPNAVKVFEELRAEGHEPVGIRLDSGDLAFLSIQAALMLDAAGFDKTTIVLSNQLEELAIWQILSQIEEEAPRYGLDTNSLIQRLSFGVGSRLITSHGASYLDGVYKVVAVDDDGEWVPTIKVSDNPEKVTIPGVKAVWRVYDSRGHATADVLALAEEELPDNVPLVLHHPSEYGTVRTVRAQEMSSVESLLSPVYVEGSRLTKAEPIADLRDRRTADVERLDPGVRRLVNPHRYHVSLTEPLWELKQKQIAEAR